MKIKSIWEEGRFYDAWMAVHFMAGVVLGLMMLAAGATAKPAYIISAAALVLWEVFEMIADIREHKENRSADILIGFLGFILSYTFFPYFTASYLKYFLILCWAFLIFSSIGWAKYFKYKKRF